mmetsp:Transcript_15413/g.37879  ORF Transcript_15413/g.37879 Transcript_15413/m.37879 type:complete len:363 (-) Transcript_15413:2305-3393(-)
MEVVLQVGPERLDRREDALAQAGADLRVHRGHRLERALLLLNGQLLVRQRRAAWPQGRRRAVESPEEVRDELGQVELEFVSEGEADLLDEREHLHRQNSAVAPRPRPPPVDHLEDVLEVRPHVLAHDAHELLQPHEHLLLERGVLVVRRGADHVEQRRDDAGQEHRALGPERPEDVGGALHHGYVLSGHRGLREDAHQGVHGDGRVVFVEGPDHRGQEVAIVCHPGRIDGHPPSAVLLLLRPPPLGTPPTASGIEPRARALRDRLPFPLLGLHPVAEFGLVDLVLVGVQRPQDPQDLDHLEPRVPLHFRRQHVEEGREKGGMLEVGPYHVPSGADQAAEGAQQHLAVDILGPVLQLAQEELE